MSQCKRCGFIITSEYLAAHEAMCSKIVEQDKAVGVRRYMVVTSDVNVRIVEDPVGALVYSYDYDRAMALLRRARTSIYFRRSVAESEIADLLADIDKELT